MCILLAFILYDLKGVAFRMIGSTFCHLEWLRSASNISESSTVKFHFVCPYLLSKAELLGHGIEL